MEQARTLMREIITRDKVSIAEFCETLLDKVRGKSPKEKQTREYNRAVTARMSRQEETAHLEDFTL